MAKFSTEDLRNVGVVGHGDTGKTTLVSACLFTCGAMNRMGRVEQGTALTDFDAEEISRQISIQSAVARATWKKHQITFIDTPGYSVFRSDTKASMRVVDNGLLLVDAVSGAGVMTEKVWEYAEGFETPLIFVINRLDRDNSSFERALESCTEIFGREVVPVQLPIGEGEDFKGIVDLLEMKAYTYEQDGNGKGTASEIPAELQAAASSAREALVEMVAESNEDLMEIYFEEGDLPQDQLIKGVAAAVSKRRLFPVLCAAGGRNVGTDRLMSACLNLFGSPAARPQLVGKTDGVPDWVEADSSAPFSALVFKTMADPFAGRISLMRVYAGAASADDTVVNSRSDVSERLTNLSLPQGKDLEHIDGVVAGQICALTKLKNTTTGDTLKAKSSELVIEHVVYPKAAISFSIQPEAKGDEEKIGTALARLLEEDPTLSIDRDAQTGETLLSGLGQLHVEVTLSKMKHRFGVSALLKPPTVPYRETFRRTAEAEGRHKKQSGGRGQFGVAKIAISPQPSGAGFEFEDKIFGGSISQQFRPAVQKGVAEAAERGILAGYPVVDFKVTLLDGKEHSVDSSEIAFKIAGSMAFKEAAQHAHPVLLEPIMVIEVTIPDEAVGDVIGDLNSRRGRVQGVEPRKGRQIIKAEAPLAEILTYAIDLNSLTGGRGSYTMEFARYDDVPPQVAQKVVEKSKRAKEEAAG